MIDKITIKGARQHNLKNIDIELPKNEFIVITGVSGSGKSSLAFDTIYSEGQKIPKATIPYTKKLDENSFVQLIEAYLTPYRDEYIFIYYD